MKKIFGIFLTAVIVAFVICSLTVISGTANVYLKGDINGDDEINAVDAVILARHIAGIEYITDSQEKKAADVNGDSIIDIEDAALFTQYLAGWSVEFSRANDSPSDYYPPDYFIPDYPDVTEPVETEPIDTESASETTDSPNVTTPEESTTPEETTTPEPATHPVGCKCAECNKYSGGGFT
ncbi:MAG: dockerin type I repeat-containing protein [Clostridia bacterium]|nr:dockerin type I repeat-containing protein [Clostridia bacterium]